MLEAERELARVTEEIEQAEGERRFYDQQVALSTLIAVTLQEPVRGPVRGQRAGARCAEALARLRARAGRVAGRDRLRDGLPGAVAA